MAKTFIEAGRRRQFTPTLLHRAGDLVFNGGFFGVTQDDAAFPSGTGAAASVADRPLVIVLDGVWDLKNNVFDGSPINAGAKIYAAPTYGATSLQLFKNPASLGASAVAIGRMWATALAGASPYLRVALFGPENQY